MSLVVAEPRTFAVNAPASAALRVISGDPASDAEFWEFCAANPDLRIERTGEGVIVIMPPTGLETGRRNNRLGFRLTGWALSDGRGEVFESSTGFRLPNGAVRSADVAWVFLAKLRELSTAQKRRSPELCPDFVIEIMSPSDRLVTVQLKMREWIDNGVQLGWLLDPDNRTVYIHRPGRDPETVANATSISGEPPIGSFVLDLDEIWSGV